MKKKGEFWMFKHPFMVTLGAMFGVCGFTVWKMAVTIGPLTHWLSGYYFVLFFLTLSFLVGGSWAFIGMTSVSSGGRVERGFTFFSEVIRPAGALLLSGIVSSWIAFLIMHLYLNVFHAT